MSGSVAGRRYAKALLEVVSQTDQVDKVLRDLENLLEVWHASPEFRDVFENPRFLQEDRGKAIRALADKVGLNAEVKNFLSLLSDRHRMRELTNVVDSFRELSEEKQGVVQAEVVTATELPEAYFAELTRTLESVTGKKVKVQRRVDASLIGGVVAKVEGRVFDGSVRSQLQTIQEELLATTA